MKEVLNFVLKKFDSYFIKSDLFKKTRKLQLVIKSCDKI